MGADRIGQQRIKCLERLLGSVFEQFVTLDGANAIVVSTDSCSFGAADCGFKPVEKGAGGVCVVQRAAPDIMRLKCGYKNASAVSSNKIIS